MLTRYPQVRLEARQDSPLRFFFGRLSVLPVRLSAAGSNSNGWHHWEWADFFATTGSMDAFGRGGRRMREEDRVSGVGFQVSVQITGVRFHVSGCRKSF